jgi:hypothetical protein
MERRTRAASARGASPPALSSTAVALVVALLLGAGRVAAAACPTPAGYTLAAGLDMFGNDIICTELGTNSTDDLARLCQATSGCVAFNVWTQQPEGVVSYCLKHNRTALSDQSTTYMTGACQGVYTGAQRACSAGLQRARLAGDTRQRGAPLSRDCVLNAPTVGRWHDGLFVGVRDHRLPTSQAAHLPTPSLCVRSVHGRKLHLVRRRLRHHV